MKKIWEKNNQEKSLKIIDDYCFKEEVTYDNLLVEYDSLGSIAHAYMLYKMNILSSDEFKKLKEKLIQIIDLYKKGKFVVEPNDEDVHTKVEAYLIDKLGEAGKKIHTARSRNDQVLVDLYLFSKNKLLEIFKQTSSLIEVYLMAAKKNEYIPMPGYTHMKKAMPSSIGLWLGSFAESLLDDLSMLKTTYELVDQSPLGSGAAYGIPLPIDRLLTTKLLGFSKIQNNSLYCQAFRPKIELAIVQALTQLMITMSKFAQDLLIFTTTEFNFFTIADKFCTGSSIMPQKKNLDLMEYLRAKTYTIIGHQQIIASIGASLPSGYNADFGETKKYLMESIKMVLQTIEVVKQIILTLKPNLEVLKKSCTKELLATQASYQLINKNLAFRDAYKKIGKDLEQIPDLDFLEVIKQTNHVGGPGNLGLKKIYQELSVKKKWWFNKENNFMNTIKNLIK